jgi:hypothetical protein
MIGLVLFIIYLVIFADSALAQELPVEKVLPLSLAIEAAYL